MNKIETIVRNYIVRHGMWKHDGSYIVALSGGADSVALLLILKNLGCPSMQPTATSTCAAKKASATNSSA